MDVAGALPPSVSRVRLEWLKRLCYVMSWMATHSLFASVRPKTDYFVSKWLCLQIIECIICKENIVRTKGNRIRANRVYALPIDQTWRPPNDTFDSLQGLIRISKSMWSKEFLNSTMRVHLDPWYEWRGQTTIGQWSQWQMDLTTGLKPNPSGCLL